MAVLVMNGDGVWIWGRGRSHIFSQTQSACSSENYQRIFVLGQVPDAMSFVGYALICTMAVLMYLYNRRREQ